MEKANQGDDQLTQVDLEKWPLNRRVCVLQTDNLHPRKWGVKAKRVTA